MSPRVRAVAVLRTEVKVARRLLARAEMGSWERPYLESLVRELEDAVGLLEGAAAGERTHADWRPERETLALQGRVRGAEARTPCAICHMPKTYLFSNVVSDGPICGICFAGRFTCLTAENARLREALECCVDALVDAGMAQAWTVAIESARAALGASPQGLK